ncbi:conserved hypothetical protein [[Clostridium] ultunense Esp]|nr:hypothetical protein [Thermicanus sp.]CCQ97777.1 conserved hypothetical protein [[Clostridium] ultunense Esp]
MDETWRIGQIVPPPLPSPTRPSNKGDKVGLDFASYLEEEKERQNPPISFSRHAEERLIERGIKLSPELTHRLEKAVTKAGEKGSKETLVIVDDLFFVVSVKNRMVITALEKAQAKENLFTHIDSAVLY